MFGEGCQDAASFQKLLYSEASKVKWDSVQGDRERDFERSQGKVRV